MKRKSRELLEDLAKRGLRVPALLVLRRGGKVLQVLLRRLIDRLVEEQAQNLRELSEYLANARRHWDQLSPEARTQVEYFEACLDQERRYLAEQVAETERQRTKRPAN
jgi:hypothetical protein